MTISGLVVQMSPTKCSAGLTESFLYLDDMAYLDKKLNGMSVFKQLIFVGNEWVDGLKSFSEWKQGLKNLLKFSFILWVFR